MSRIFAKKIYQSKKWKECRELIYKKYHGLCAECGKPGDEVHHKIFLDAINCNDPNIVYGEDNLVLLCRDCHFEKHRATNPLERNFRKPIRLTNNGTYFDSNGEIKPCKRYIIYGAPGSGKSKYVKEHMEYGDLVIDLDLIKQAISLKTKADAPDNLLSVALTMREAAYRLISNKEVDAKNVWIIATLPKRQERQQLAERLNAEIVYMNKDIQSCIQHATSENEGVDKDLQIYIIKRWFELHES